VIGPFVMSLAGWGIVLAGIAAAGEGSAKLVRAIRRWQERRNAVPPFDQERA
jgi:hypothetical protein